MNSAGTSTFNITEWDSTAATNEMYLVIGDWKPLKFQIEFQMDKVKNKPIRQTKYIQKLMNRRGWS